MYRIAFVALGLAVFTACEEENACDRWADYVCTCHDGEPGFDCEALLELAESPTQTTVDQCAFDLAEQQDIDEEEGLDCPLL